MQGFDLDNFLLNKTESQNIGRLWQPISGQPVRCTKIWPCPIKVQGFRRPWHTLAQNSNQSKIRYDFSKVFQIFGQNSRILKIFKKKLGASSRSLQDTQMMLQWLFVGPTKWSAGLKIGLPYLRDKKSVKKGHPHYLPPWGTEAEIFLP